MAAPINTVIQQVSTVCSRLDQVAKANRLGKWKWVGRKKKVEVSVEVKDLVEALDARYGFLDNLFKLILFFSMINASAVAKMAWYFRFYLVNVQIISFNFFFLL